MTRVLIVDDDESLSSIVAEFLRLQDFDVRHVNDAESAYNILTDEIFDVVLLDINLPDDSGFEVCSQIRRQSDVAIIFASARTKTDDEIHGLDLGADDYIAKPYSMRELLAHIQAVIRRSAASTTGELTVGSVVIDPVSRTVRVDGKDTSLSPKEFDLLLYLMSHAGTPVATSRLLAEVWGAFSEVEPSTVAVHISWLRRKLEADPSHPSFIKTVPKTGYMVVDPKAVQ